jgi:hypothetical protein
MRLALAFAAALMQMLWPLAGQLRAAEPQVVQVLCTVHGTMTVPFDDAPKTDSAKPSCAMCGAAGVAITSAVVQARRDTPSLAASAALPNDAAQLPHYASFRPRAPPAAS